MIIYSMKVSIIMDIYLSKLKEFLKLNDIDIKAEKELEYGVQLSLTHANNNFTLRIYQNNKGKITLDTSLIKDAVIKSTIQKFEQIDSKHSPAISPDIMQTLEKIDNENPNIVSAPLIGTDEAGKGDLFGSLSVGGVFADEKAYDELCFLGVKDSKKLSDKQMREMKKEIVAICPNNYVMSLPPAELNKAYEKYLNINIILAKMHAKVILSLNTTTSCRRVLTDKFTSKQRIQTELAGSNIDFHEQTHAEKNICVAAASILARCAFLESIDKISSEFDMNIPLGAGNITDIAAMKIYEKFGEDSLHRTVKTFFKNIQKIRSLN